MPIIRPAQQSDWDRFCSLAAAEGWRVPQFELQLFQADWSHCVQVLEVEGGFTGLVTAIPYERSGWIGNLIVPTHLRGKGYGGRLFQAALDDLADRAMSTVWLTASASGRPIYEKSGFKAIDRVERWVFPKRGCFGPGVETQAVAGKKLRDCDRTAWGENRHSLLDHLLVHSQVFACDDSVALLQKGSDVQIIGPWYSQSDSPQENQNLLRELLAAADPGVEIVADLLASSPLRHLLVAAGFERTGAVALMAKGEHCAADLKTMVSLASLGSLG